MRIVIIIFLQNLNLQTKVKNTSKCLKWFQEFSIKNIYFLKTSSPFANNVTIFKILSSKINSSQFLLDTFIKQIRHIELFNPTLITNESNMEHN